jgi:hypothetical protein
MRRLIAPLAPLALVIGLFAGTGSAAAAPPTPNDTTPFQFVCPGFTVDAQVTGKSKLTDWLRPFPASKPIPLYTETGAATTITLTSVTPFPKTVRYSINGSRRVALSLDPIDFVYTATGRNLMYVPPAYGTPGIFLSEGLVTWTLFGPVYPYGGMTGPGKITDVCQVLAP